MEKPLVSRSEGSTTFADLNISSDIVDGLKAAGFIRPTPIQAKAIPPGRRKTDLIVQAKSGTGKTLVFAILSIGAVELKNLLPQVLILAPTRETAAQVCEVIHSIASFIPTLKCEAFIGGYSLALDKKVLASGCHVVIGTPGRMEDLIRQNMLRTSNIRLLVYDEVDALFTEAFLLPLKNIYLALPSEKQILAVSATLSGALIAKLEYLMVAPKTIRLSAPAATSLASARPKRDKVNHGMDAFTSLSAEHEVWIHDIKQYYARTGQIERLAPHDTKFRVKVELLNKVLCRRTFEQCVIFCNHRERGRALADALDSDQWPTVFVSGNLSQKERFAAIDAMHDGEARLLVCTDVIARGVNFSGVDLVLNLDVPRDPVTYVHRIGRSGRPKDYGTAITLVHHEEERQILAIAHFLGAEIAELTFQHSPSIHCEADRSYKRSDGAFNCQDTDESSRLLQSNAEARSTRQLAKISGNCEETKDARPSSSQDGTMDIASSQDRAAKSHEISNIPDLVKLQVENECYTRWLHELSINPTIY